MGFAIEFRAEHMVVRFDPGTVLTFDVVQAALFQQRERPENQTLNDIWDTRGCRADSLFDGDDVMGVIDYIQTLHSAGYHRRTALVVDSEESYGISRMFQTLGEDLPYDIQVFRDMERAREWVLAKT